MEPLENGDSRDAALGLARTRNRLLARAGLRIGEALALRVSDIDLDGMMITVEREKVRGEKVRGQPRRGVIGPPKSEHGVRTVRMTPQLAAVLRRHLEVERKADKLGHGWRSLPPWLFYAEHDPATYAASEPAAGTLDDSNVRRVMRSVLQALHDEDRRAGKPQDECFPLHYTPHGYRHTFASQLLAEGKELHYVRHQLGHESTKLTADTYGSDLPPNPKHTNDCLDDAALESVTTQS